MEELIESSVTSAGQVDLLKESLASVFQAEAGELVLWVGPSVVNKVVGWISFYQIMALA